MNTRLIVETLLALVLSAILALLVAPFIAEKPFPFRLGIEAKAQVIEKTSRTLYTSDNAVLEEVFYITAQYPVKDGGIERAEISVTEAFFDRVAKNDLFDLLYNSEDTEQLWFEGKKEPLSLYVWMVILTICSLPVFFFILSLVSFSRANNPG